MSIKDKLPLINSSNKGIRIVGYVFYVIVILVILGAILSPAPVPLASAEEKTAMSVTLEDYNFTAFLPSGWAIGGEHLSSRDLPNAYWKGAVWDKAFYSGDEDSIGMMVETIPEDLRSSSQQAIIEDLALGSGYTFGYPLKKTTFDGKEALTDEDINDYGNLINFYMFMPNNTLVVVSAIDQTNKKAKDLLENFEVKKAT
ncbi:MAG: hypothetical protein MUO26_04315 [Methanotrichaceae archaeon]|nr:hypothetical protein [Methanotrichaceae archaeon]